MNRHGSESYFVIGEGLLGESVGGRDRTLAAPVEAATAPFRFSRMGPSGINHQLSDGLLARLAAVGAGGGGESKIPAGFTYLGQFVDHDLSFDKTAVMLGENVSATELLQARSPSLDLDSLYGAGPDDPGSEKFYEDDGIHLKARPSHSRADSCRVRSPPRRREHHEGQAEGDHPRPEERREPRRCPDARGDDPVPQPRGRHAPQLGPCGQAVRARAGS